MPSNKLLAVLTACERCALQGLMVQQLLFKHSWGMRMHIALLTFSGKTYIFSDFKSYVQNDEQKLYKWMNQTNKKGSWVVFSVNFLDFSSHLK